MSERIYNVNPDGELEPMEEQPFVSEDGLQELLAKHPELLDGGQVRPDAPRRWILISREMGIAERSQESPRWSLDHLIVDQDAVPTLVEVKRSSNTEIRRTIVGQLLEYAAHASDTWTVDTMRERYVASCEKSGDDPVPRLARLLQTDDADVEVFFQEVATNLAARRMRLLFVADEIPDPLLRVVEFLNQQMPNIEVLAVEIKQYSGTARRTLVPRVLGRIAGSPETKPGNTRRPNLTRDSFLAAFQNNDDREVAVQLLDMAPSVGVTFMWGSTGVSLRAACPQWGQAPITVAILTAPGKQGGWPGEGLTGVHFGEGVSGFSPPPSEGVKYVLDRYVSSFAEDGFFTYVEKGGRRGWTATYANIAPHLDAIEDRLETVVQELEVLS